MWGLEGTARWWGGGGVMNEQLLLVLILSGKAPVQRDCQATAGEQATERRRGVRV